MEIKVRNLDTLYVVDFDRSVKEVTEKQDVQFTKLGRKIWKEYGTLDYKTLKYKIAYSVKENEMSSEDQESLDTLKELHKEYGTTNIDLIIESLKEKDSNDLKRKSNFNAPISSNENRYSKFNRRSIFK